MNPEACRLAKYFREEMLTLRNADIVTREEEGRIAPELERADAGPVVENRWLLLCSDQTRVPLDLVVQRLPGNRYLAIGRDLTERERALGEIAAARDAANAAKSRFLAAASHDLRQPIQAINLLCDSLARTGLHPDQRRITASMQSAIASLGALLDIAKLDSGMMVPNPEVMSTTQLFTRIDAEFSPLATVRGLRFLLHFPFDDLYLDVDPKLLNMMLGNLIGAT